MTGIEEFVRIRRATASLSKRMQGEKTKKPNDDRAQSI